MFGTQVCCLWHLECNRGTGLAESDTALGQGEGKEPHLESIFEGRVSAHPNPPHPKRASSKVPTNFQRG